MAIERSSDWRNRQPRIDLRGRGGQGSHQYESQAIKEAINAEEAREVMTWH